jgi:hypothetical protein
MSAEPTVCAIMLTADRPEFAKRAVECFRRQTYPHCRMLIWDTGALPDSYPKHGNGVLYHNASNLGRKTIGELRNDANGFVMLPGVVEIDILIHWDDDDWAHPSRIAEQVALLKNSGADCVGYNEMLFWREERNANFAGCAPPYHPGEAWLYTGSILGTSLCYWRKTWERVPFRSQRLNPRHDPGVGEDQDFLLDLAAAGMKKVNRVAFGEITDAYGLDGFTPVRRREYGDPRMIARIHAGNTSNAYDPAQMAAHPQHWRRVPEWDTYCRSAMG